MPAAVASTLSWILAAVLLTACGDAATESTSTDKYLESGGVPRTSPESDAGDSSASTEYSTGQQELREARAAASGATANVGTGPLVSFLGDSITAGLHLPADEAFPALLAKRFAAKGQPIRFVNAGLSGDTSSGGLRRLEWQLRQKPDIVVVELGANDGLRGIELDSVEANLRALVRRAQEAEALVLLLGMKIPGNYGLDYTRGFSAIYKRIAEDEDVPLIPFFMQSVVMEAGMMLPDGLHPSTVGHEALADTVEPALQELLDELASAKG